MFLYPFRVLGWLSGLVLASVVIQFFTGPLKVRWFPRFEVWSTPDALAFGVVGVLLEAFWCLFALKIAVEGLRSGARGSDQHSTRDNWIEDDEALRQLLLWAGVLLAGYLLFRHFGHVAFYFYCALLALLLPAVLVLLGMGDTLKGALNPSNWQQLLSRTGARYPLLVVQLTGLVLLAWLLQVEVIPPAPRWLAVPLSRLTWLYALFAGYHGLGRMLDRTEGAPARAETAAAAVPAELTEKEELAMGAALRYAGEQRYARGSLELKWLAGRPGTSAKVHWRYREMLALAGDEAGLLKHASFYASELLGLGHEQEALALYEDSLTMDPAFELTDPARFTQLLQVAVRERKEELAIQLALQFSRRFPEEPDALPNGLSAARLLDRQGKDEQARQLLVDLARRFPAHPQRAELLAALETLEHAARRG
jgi:hypothetical protein